MVVQPDQRCEGPGNQRKTGRCVRVLCHRRRGKQDAYFESDGKRLLSHMLFAAAVGHRPITDVFTWAPVPTDKTSRDLLYNNGYVTLANALEQIQNLTEKQRDGVYGTMRPWVNVLSYDQESHGFATLA